MAATLYLITRSGIDEGNDDGFVDGVTGVVINLDPATYTSNAALCAEAAKACNAMSDLNPAGTEEDTRGANIPNEFKHNYFNTVQVLGTPTQSGVLVAPNTSIIIQDVKFGGISDVQAAVS